MKALVFSLKLEACMLDLNRLISDTIKKVSDETLIDEENTEKRISGD